MNESHRTYCRICAVQCGMIVETDADRIVSITSDKAHPITKGYLCFKGVTSQDLHNGEGRLLRARKRLEDGTPKDIETSVAIDEIHDKLANRRGAWVNRCRYANRSLAESPILRNLG